VSSASNRRYWLTEMLTLLITGWKNGAPNSVGDVVGVGQLDVGHANGLQILVQQRSASCGACARCSCETSTSGRPAQPRSAPSVYFSHSSSHSRSLEATIDGGPMAQEAAGDGHRVSVQKDAHGRVEQRAPVAQRDREARLLGDPGPATVELVDDLARAIIKEPIGGVVDGGGGVGEAREPLVALAALF
jgi:hypothetical protein